MRGYHLLGWDTGGRGETELKRIKKKKTGTKNASLPSLPLSYWSFPPSLHKQISRRSSVSSSDNIFPMMQYLMCSQLVASSFLYPVSHCWYPRCHLDISPSSSFLISKKHSTFFLKFCLLVSGTSPSLFSPPTFQPQLCCLHHQIMFSIKCSKFGVFKNSLGNFSSSSVIIYMSKNPKFYIQLELLWSPHPRIFKWVLNCNVPTGSTTQPSDLPTQSCFLSNTNICLLLRQEAWVATLKSHSSPITN